MGRNGLTTDDLPRAIRENAGLIQFINGRIVMTTICIAMVLFGEFYWPVTVIAGMAAAQLWVLSKHAHRRDGDPYRPIAQFWNREEPTADIALKVVAALASEKWRQIKRPWYTISVGRTIAISVSSPLLKRAMAESEPYQFATAGSLLFLVVSFGAWASLLHYWYATLQARFLKRTLLADVK